MTTNFQNIPIYDSLEKKVGHEKVENFDNWDPYLLRGKRTEKLEIKIVRF